MLKYLASTMTLYLALTTTAFACDLSVTDPWIREAPPSAKALAGYMVVKMLLGAVLIDALHAALEDRVVALDRVRMDFAAHVFVSTMLHRTVEKDGMAEMVHQEKVTIPAGGELVFKPKDYHIMLMRPQQPLDKGDSVAVTLVHDDGNEQKVVFPVR